MTIAIGRRRLILSLIVAPSGRKSIEIPVAENATDDEHRTQDYRGEFDDAENAGPALLGGSVGFQVAGHPIYILTAIREVPDMIISDLKMPRMDGYELIHNLRGIPGLASVPVIALTGFGMKKDIEAALAAGYDACLNKPVEISELSAVIQRLAAQRLILISKH